jgi:hypothetical protein
MGRAWPKDEPSTSFEAVGLFGGLTRRGTDLMSIRAVRKRSKMQVAAGISAKSRVGLLFDGGDSRAALSNQVRFQIIERLMIWEDDRAAAVVIEVSL